MAPLEAVLSDFILFPYEKFHTYMFKSAKKVKIPILIKNKITKNYTIFENKEGRLSEGHLFEAFLYLILLPRTS